MSKVQKTATEWQAELTPQEFQICREKGTERAFTGEYWNCHDEFTVLWFSGGVWR